jgi:DNA-directed RNA polymerase subunit A"
LVAKEALVQTRISGINGAEGAFPTMIEGKWGIRISGAKTSMWEDLETLLGDFIDINTIWSDDAKVIQKIFGIETALLCLEEQFNDMTNGNKEKYIKGIGEYDYRYIRSVIDIIGVDGEIRGLGAHGVAGKHNPSLLGALSFEETPGMLRAGVVMANDFNFRGVAESVNSGRTLDIGREYRPE